VGAPVDETPVDELPELGPFVPASDPTLPEDASAVELPADALAPASELICSVLATLHAATVHASVTASSPRRRAREGTLNISIHR
jgi:hypothetical protein